MPRPGGPGAATAPRGEPSAWMVAPMVVGVIALLVLGLHPPDALAALIARGAAELGGAW
jgi:hydrogenase-4 component F